MQLKDTKGDVYLFRYKINKTDDWKMGISGLQSTNNKDVSSNGILVKLTDKKIKRDEPEMDQFNEQIKRLMLTQHKSARRFFDRGSGGGWDFTGGDFEN